MRILSLFFRIMYQLNEEPHLMWGKLMFAPQYDKENYAAWNDRPGTDG
jgi:hypothetical protein